MERNEQKTVSIKLTKVLEYLLYLLGAVFIMAGCDYYFEDLDYSSSPLQFYEKTYVGGDAYNYIISATRSTAIMVKSLIWMVLGCSSIIVGRTIALRSWKSK